MTFFVKHCSDLLLPLNITAEIYLCDAEFVLTVMVKKKVLNEVFIKL